MNTFADIIRKERKKMGLTQREFADYSGLGLRFVKELEQGKSTVRLDKLEQALNFFGYRAGPVEIDYYEMHENTPVSVVIKQVIEICRVNEVEHLMLYGSYAKKTFTEYSDLDFAVKGCKCNLEDLRNAVNEIRTLKSIDFVDYDTIQNDLLREDIDTYGIKIY